MGCDNLKILADVTLAVVQDAQLRCNPTSSAIPMQSIVGAWMRLTNFQMRTYINANGP